MLTFLRYNENENHYQKQAASKLAVHMTSRSLAELTVGTGATIVEFAGSLPSKTKKRLQDLGLCPERSIQILRRTPFGGPISIAVGGLVLALDSQIAQHIVVTAA